MPTESNIELGAGTVYIDGVEFGTARDIKIKNELDQCNQFNEYFKLIDLSATREASFELKMSTKNYLKVIRRTCGFWFTVKFIFKRIWRTIRGSL
jgi:hypothetical protein